jgi:hypothetical protein
VGKEEDKEKEQKGREDFERKFTFGRPLSPGVLSFPLPAIAHSTLKIGQ